MEKKQQYRAPTMELFGLCEEEVIRTSGTEWPDEWSDALDQLDW